MLKTESEGGMHGKTAVNVKLQVKHHNPFLLSGLKS